MKNKIVLLGMLALMVAPSFSLRAGDGEKAKKEKAPASAKNAVVVSHPNRETIYITNRTVTGSNIPVVVTRYQGHNIASSPFVSYDQTDLGVTGTSSVAAELVTRDPAISFGPGRR